MGVIIAIFTIALFIGLAIHAQQGKLEAEKKAKQQAWREKLQEQRRSKSEQNSQPYRTFGVTVVETRTEKVDGISCDVANFAVKGLRFRSEEDQDAARSLQVGDCLTMEPEPDNPKDSNAMKVFMQGGHHIGYVDGKCAGYVKESLPRLVKFIVSKVDDYGDPPYIYAEAFFKKE